jgi:hypothetical protein
VDDPARVQQGHLADTCGDEDLGARDARGARTSDDHPFRPQLTAENPCGALQRREHHHRGAVLVVVHDRAVQRLDQLRLQLEAARRGDVLEVHRTERRPQPHQRLDDLVHVGRVEHQRDRVQPAEGLEQRGLALHHREGRGRADVTETQHGRSIADHGDEAVGPGVLGGGGGVVGDRPAHLGHARGVGDRERARVRDRPGHTDVELAALVRGEDLLVGDRVGQVVVRHGPVIRCSHGVL